MGNASRARSFALTLGAQQRVLDFQMQAIESIDSKTGMIFGLATAVLTVPAALLAREVADVPRSTIILLVFALLAYVAVAVLSILAIYVRKWVFGVKIEVVQKRAAALDEAEFASWLAGRYGRAYQRNEEAWWQKAWLSLWAMVAFAAEALLISLAAILTIAD